MQNNSPKSGPVKGEDFFKLVCGFVIEQGGEALLSFSEEEKKIQARLHQPQAEQGIDELCSYLLGATQEVLSQSTGTEIQYAKTIQEIASVHLKPDVGCFVQFNGDYQGLLIMNFSTSAALELFREYMLHMGMPEEEIASSHVSEEVIDSIGEFVNQIIGQFRQKIEQRYGLVAHNSQPKAIHINEAITLSIGPQKNSEQYRRLSFRIHSLPFQAEIAFETSQFRSIEAL